MAGCGYVHVGRLPEPTATVIGDEKLMKENSDLRLEKKLLQQELALTRAQGDALRMAIENRTADGDTSRRLTEKLNETMRELALLRANYARLQAERNAAVASATEADGLRSRLGAAEEKLAASLRTYTELQDEIGRLRNEVDKTRTENVALSEQVKVVTSQNALAQAALAQLNTDLLAQKDARVRAEQDAETLRTQLQSGPNASILAQQRTGAAAEARTLAAEQAAEIVALRRDLDTYRAKVDALDRERAQLQQQLARSGPSAELANLEAKLTDSIRTNSLLRDENELLRSTKSGLEPQLASLRNGPATDQAQALRDQLRSAQATATALTEENSRLKTQLAEAERKGSRFVNIEPVTRINLDAPVPARGGGRGGVGSGGDTTPAAGEGAEPASASPTAIPSGPTITRAAAPGVNATLVTSVPASRPVAAKADLPGQARVHVVAGGDTLSKISSQYYGTPTRWTDILNANRDILGENNNLVIGRTLRIP